MKIYFLSDTEWCYDSYTDVAVIADDEDEARQLAVEYFKDRDSGGYGQYPEWWLNKEKVIVEEIRDIGKGVVLAQFRHG